MQGPTQSRHPWRDGIPLRHAQRQLRQHHNECNQRGRLLTGRPSAPQALPPAPPGRRWPPAAASSCSTSHRCHLPPCPATRDGSTSSRVNRQGVCTGKGGAQPRLLAPLLVQAWCCLGLQLGMPSSTVPTSKPASKRSVHCSLKGAHRPPRSCRREPESYAWPTAQPNTTVQHSQYSTALPKKRRPPCRPPRS